MAAKRPVRQRRGGSKVSPKKKRQLFLPESSGRTSCLVMSAVPPELPDMSGPSRARNKRCPRNAGPAAHLLAPAVSGCVQFAAPGCSFTQGADTAPSCAALSGLYRTALLFPIVAFLQ